MHRIFYQPAERWFGDCMPFFHDGVYYLFHQRDTRRPGPFGEPFGWALVTTTDFVTYEDHGEVLPGGGDDAQDQFIFAGSVFRAGDEFFAFYTGYNRDYRAQGRPSQVLQVARSTDLIHWEKTDRLHVAPQPGYDPDDWRDPVVLWDEEKQHYLMILGGRREGPKTRTTGSTVAFTSTDLVEWTFDGDFWAPGRFTMQEMPDLFRAGGRWYHLITEYSSESKTVYRVSDSLEGPWTAPFDDAFDGRAYYAARSAGEGDQQFLFGWVATKEDEDDARGWEWGGTLVVHEVVLRPDGSLGVKAPDGVAAAFGEVAGRLPQPVTLSSAGDVVRLPLGSVDAETYRVLVRLRLAGDATFGLRFAEDEESGVSYRYGVSTARRSLVFDRHPSYPWPRYDNRGIARPVVLEPGEHVLDLQVDGSIAVLYLDDVALSTRVYDRVGSEIALDVEVGTVEVLSVEVQEHAG
ncbi:beta-fructofuranosidase [Salana multivorans]|uniref:beta-fructofuranosidase n=1 Tax=Salana multivorans TaxID=120377 RepID=A0A3N2D9N3_9MICO|nr:GH32 C-terminal domain-containing protein [Salana multivorans]ROR96348.1 beta-fructofuranosidase [Salana multivorans]